jgi:cation diffusion facilitator CzcD-associated flavoprotein CzcO
MMAYKIQQSLKHAELVMYDKNTDIGGTWFENKYPGAGCDIQYCAYQKDIWKYRECAGFQKERY